MNLLGIMNLSILEYLFNEDKNMSIYLKASGIEGDITTKGFEQQINIRHMRFYISRNYPGEVGRQSDRENSKPSLSDILITKEVDKTTPLWFQQALSMGPIDEVVLSVVRSGADVTTYMEITLQKVMVSQYELDAEEAKAGEEKKSFQKPLEHIGLNYTHIEVRYIPSDEEAKAQGPVSSSYDLVTANAA